jgi:hypothetical protein
MTSSPDSAGIVARLLRETDGLRYQAGAEWAPIRPTPSDLVWSQGTAQLWRYRSDAIRYADPS